MTCQKGHRQILLAWINVSGSVTLNIFINGSFQNKDCNCHDRTLQSLNISLLNSCRKKLLASTKSTCSAICSTLLKLKQSFREGQRICWLLKASKVSFPTGPDKSKPFHVVDHLYLWQTQDCSSCFTSCRTKAAALSRWPPRNCFALLYSY